MAKSDRVLKTKICRKNQPDRSTNQREALAATNSRKTTKKQSVHDMSGRCTRHGLWLRAEGLLLMAESVYCCILLRWVPGGMQWSALSITTDFYPTESQFEAGYVVAI